MKLKSFKKSIRRCRQALWDDAAQQPSDEDHLVKAYMAQHDHHFHIRRTLDQFYYIGMKDTEGRDQNQVVQRYAVKEFHKICEEDDKVLLQQKMIMVDQLWLWVLGKGGFSLRILLYIMLIIIKPFININQIPSLRASHKDGVEQILRTNRTTNAESLTRFCHILESHSEHLSHQ